MKKDKGSKVTKEKTATPLITIDQDPRLLSGNNAAVAPERIVVFAVTLAILFVFASAGTMVWVAIYQCIFGNQCSLFDGLTHLICAWVGTALGAILGYRFGSSRGEARILTARRPHAAEMSSVLPS
jgi:hypothetical protein